MVASEIIREVSLDLNDQELGHEYRRWTVYQLQTYLREALVSVSKPLKDLFVEYVVVKVKPGPGWQKACDCTSINRILGESTAAGQLIYYLSRSMDIEANTWAGPIQNCPRSPRDYQMVGYTINSVDDSQFRITPPMFPGMDKYVLVECYIQPLGELTENVPDEIMPMVKQWMLYRALFVDSENNPAIIELAKAHKDTFFELLETAIAERVREKKENDNLRTVQNSSSD